MNLILQHHYRIETVNLISEGNLQLPMGAKKDRKEVDGLQRPLEQRSGRGAVRRTDVWEVMRNWQTLKVSEQKHPPLPMLGSRAPGI